LTTDQTTIVTRSGGAGIATVVGGEDGGESEGTEFGTAATGEGGPSGAALGFPGGVEGVTVFSRGGAGTDGCAINLSNSVKKAHGIGGPDAFSATFERRCKVRA